VTDDFLFAIGCGVTALAFGGVYVYMRSKFEHMVEPPRSERGAAIQNASDIPDQEMARRVHPDRDAL